MNNILLLGAPGCGKGTQAKLLEDNLGYNRIDTGSLIRTAIKNQTELGKQAKSYVEAGKLIPDNLVIGLILDEANKLTRENKKILFDGFPRNIPQADALKGAGINLDKIIEITIPEEKLIERIVGRRICTNRECAAVYHVQFKPTKALNICDICCSELYQRNDDKEELVQARINTYKQETLVLTEYYQDNLVTVNGDKKSQEVFESIQQVL